jgi:hypothetical protein
MLRRHLTEAGETLLGAVWWGTANVVGILIGVMLILAPLIMANLIAEVLTVDPIVAVGTGVIAAYAIGFWPWNGESVTELLVSIGSAAVTAVAFDLVRGGADASTLGIALAIAALGWPIRRAVSRRWPDAA